MPGRVGQLAPEDRPDLRQGVGEEGVEGAVVVGRWDPCEGGASFLPVGTRQQTGHEDGQLHSERQADVGVVGAQFLSSMADAGDEVERAGRVGLELPRLEPHVQPVVGGDRGAVGEALEVGAEQEDGVAVEVPLDRLDLAPDVLRPPHLALRVVVDPLQRQHVRPRRQRDEGCGAVVVATACGQQGGGGADEERTSTDGMRHHGNLRSLEVAALEQGRGASEGDRDPCEQQQHRRPGAEERRVFEAGVLGRDAGGGGRQRAQGAEATD